MTYKPKQSEDTLQRHCVQWFATQYPALYKAKRLFHCPNGGSRNVIEATKLKRMGVQAGVLDLFLLIPKGQWHGLIVELKVGDNSLSEHQEVFIKAHEADYSCHICYTLEEFQAVVKEYLSLKAA